MHNITPIHLRPSQLKNELSERELQSLDEDHEVVERPDYSGEYRISEIFGKGVMLKSKEECEARKRPKGRFFCNYKLAPLKKNKYQLVPLRDEKLSLVLQRESREICPKSPHNKWKVLVNPLDAQTKKKALEESLRNHQNQAPRSESNLLTPKKAQIKKIFDEETSDDEPTPSKKSRQSVVRAEVATPSTPTTKGIPARRKSILKTPTVGRVSTPRRSIQFSERVQQCNFVKDKISLREEDEEDSTDNAIARRRLHVSAVPKSLPCREKEFTEIYSFLEGNLVDEVGGCIYISGVPGTGKTATTTRVIEALKAEVKNDNLPYFDFVEINGMRITEPRKAYVEIHRQLTGKTATCEQAFSLLDKRFSTPTPRRVSTILIVDELDILCNKRQDVVYNLLNWPNLSSARLTVVTIANTMDLPERVFMGKVASRLGLTRLTFQPYSHKQLQEIVASRLSGLDSFHSDAIQLVARKVAALSGDARRALDICRRASEIAEREAKDGKASVSMSHVQEALGEMISCNKVKAIQGCSKMEQLFLEAVCMEVQRTGIEEVVFRGVLAQLKQLATLKGVRMTNTSTIYGISVRMNEQRLLICEHSRKGINMKILLNISADDFYYATKLNNQDQD